MSALLYGSPEAQEVSKRIARPALTMAEMQGWTAVANGMRAVVLADGSRWVFNTASVLTADGVLVASSGGTGRWLREVGQALLVLPFTFATADAAILLTLQAGCLIRMKEFAWQIGADFTGGATPAIGVSSSNKSGYTTKGDLLGGASGDLTATLVAASGLSAAGTIGAQWGTIALRRPFWKPTETLRFDRIASAFTAGSGAALVAVDILAHPGA